MALSITYGFIYFANAIHDAVTKNKIPQDRAPVLSEYLSMFIANHYLFFYETVEPQRFLQKFQTYMRSFQDTSSLIQGFIEAVQEQLKENPNPQSLTAMSLDPKKMLTDDVQSRWILDLILRMNNLPPVLKAKLEQERPRLINHPRVLDVNDFFDFVIEEVAGETIHEREILKSRFNLNALTPALNCYRVD